MEKILSFLGTLTLGTVLPVLFILVVGILAIRIIMKIVDAALSRTKLDPVAHKLIKSLLQTVLYVLLGLMVASRLGIDVTGVVALASVLTLAISLSVQSALTNVISGFTLLYTKPFVAGDYVEIAGQSGTVQTINLTYTKLTTPDNKIVSIPNSAVTSAEIVNYTTMGTRRVDTTVGVSYDCPVDDVLEALCTAAQIDTVFADPAPFAALKSYGDSTINYVLQVWCKGEDYWTTTFEINKNIKAVFEAKNICMTYPHINVHLDK